MVHEHAEMGLAVAQPLIIRGRNLDRMSDLAWEIRSGDADKVRHWVTACLCPFGLLTQKCHRLGGLNKYLFLKVPEAGKSQIRVPANLVSDESPLPGLHMAAFLLILTWQRENKL